MQARQLLPTLPFIPPASVDSAKAGVFMDALMPGPGGHMMQVCCCTCTLTNPAVPHPPLPWLLCLPVSHPAPAACAATQCTMLATHSRLQAVHHLRPTAASSPTLGPSPSPRLPNLPTCLPTCLPAHRWRLCSAAWRVPSRWQCRLGSPWSGRAATSRPLRSKQPSTRPRRTPSKRRQMPAGAWHWS